ncbi:MAG TPA: hydrogenase [Peptococcaceae bacterium]|nr:MAG: F420-nonreducing hydrogenase subunit D [Clostridia bacterium 41_269]HBT20222.1 hydrogenase [Peptococcaceae bacterium]
MKTEKIKIIGCGNPLASDDGVGAYIIGELKKLKLPRNVEAVEAGNNPLSLLDLIQNTKKVIIVDAVKGHGPPGKVYRLKPRELEKCEKSISLHRLEIKQILEMAKKLFPDRTPEEIIIIGVEAKDLTPFKMKLSEPVKKAVPQIIEAVLKEITS